MHNKSLLSCCFQIFFDFGFQQFMMGNSLVVQWLGFRASTAGGMGSVPGQGTKIPQTTQHGQKKKQKQNPKNQVMMFLAVDLSEFTLLADY